jgi:NAD-dependent deacetylase
MGKESIYKIACLIAASKKLVAFSGAGISTESGIPDFRGPGGIWTRYDPDDFTYQKFIQDAEARKKHWNLLLGSEFIKPDVSPNPAHYALAELERMGKLDCLITQNVDGLHEMAGSSKDKVIHLHGTMERAKCLSCGNLYPIEEVRAWLSQGVEDPRCPKCGGLLKPDAVLFGESMPVWETREAQRRSQNCDLFVVVGSSLVVYPAALMPRYALESGAKLIVVNQLPTDLDEKADILIHGKAGEVLPQVVEVLKEAGV